MWVGTQGAEWAQRDPPCTKQPGLPAEPGPGPQGAGEGVWFVHHPNASSS